ncbi:transposase [Hymenobacter psoromatis]|uniref:IS701 family transposase n=1 Tax=Hymenobacter psoromatis TaxID=1484116 RepID=UPI001CBE8CFC|nr:transposase [Hymenobacter psoromatis]
MPSLPSEFLAVLLPYTGLFCRRVFAHAQLLVVGAILAPGKRTITSVLRIVGRQHARAFGKYHRVLSQARWSARAAGRVLLTQLVVAFVGTGPVLVGLDETLERRWGAQIAARGIYRDAVRSSRDHFVKCSGLRWVSLVLLAPIPWAGRVWALPFLTALAPSLRWAQAQKRRHKTLPDWARQLLLQVTRWLPSRAVIAVGDSGYAVLDLLHAVRPYVTFITRLRLDAALYAPAPPRPAGQKGRPRLKGARLPLLHQLATHAATRWQALVLPADARSRERAVEVATDTALWYHAGKPPVPIRWVLVRQSSPQGEQLSAFLSTDLTLEAAAIVTYFSRRWAIETTFAQVRAHLGVETQRQWSEQAIARTTPVLLGLFSLVTLLAHRLHAHGLLVAQTSSWYVKPHLTFSDAIAAVRRHLWAESLFSTSDADAVTVKLTRHQFSIWQEALTWAA